MILISWIQVETILSNIEQIEAKSKGIISNTKFWKVCPGWKNSTKWNTILVEQAQRKLLLQ